MDWVWVGLTAIGGYLLGCFSTGYYAGVLIKKRDIRKFGSGNAGATNTLRVWGMPMAGLVLAGDMLKAILAVLLGRWLCGYAAGPAFGVEAWTLGGYLGGLMAVVGHNWPVFLKFRGGKGIGPSMGVFLMCSPVLALCCLAFAILLIAVFRYVSLASILGVTAMFLGILGIQWAGGFADVPIVVLYGIMAAMALYSHRANIRRLATHSENRISFSRKG